jgi:hypothetical protein
LKIFFSRHFPALALALACAAGAHAQAIPPVGNSSSTVQPSALPLTAYVPIDSWAYAAIDRLHALGFVDTAYLDLKPYTRLSIDTMLDQTADAIHASSSDEAIEIYNALEAAYGKTWTEDENPSNLQAAVESTYTRSTGIAGLPLRDSFHLGQTIANDYGRPYQQGYNGIDGFSAAASKGRLSLYVRGEYQRAASATGYNTTLADQLAALDLTPYATNPNQATIPLGPIATTDVFRIVEANLSYNLGGHQFSFGKMDRWLGPALGGSFAYSNNAENIYTFQIDRVEPLSIPLLSRLIGPVRYIFFVGSLKGHTDPNDPWMHVEKISFKPTPNLEFGFERSVIWGGEGHVPITLHTFFRSFFSTANVTPAIKNSPLDPGARFGTFDFSYRLPFVRNWFTLYTDSLSHDDVSPVDAPRRAGVRPGLYLSHVPGIPRLDIRAEAADTDPVTSRSTRGAFLYAEGIQLQGYTNKGFIMGDAIGREDKGGNAWITYHLSPLEQIAISYRRVKAAKDFIAGGTTQDDYKVSLVKRLRPEFELRADVQYESWKAPIYDASLGLPTHGHSDTVAEAQLTWFPKLSITH